MKIYFYTFGCKVNQYETQATMQLMEKHGYTVAEWNTKEHCNEECVVVVNSCTVTAESDRKVRQMLRRIRKQNDQVVIVLTGCFAQVFSEKAQGFGLADIILGNVCRGALPSVLQEYFQTRRTMVSVSPHTSEYEDLSVERFDGKTRAFIKIEDGCNRFCSYCIIPYARGRVRSKSLEKLKEETQRLAAQGFCEVVLVGINLTAYGQDNGTDIADAVETVCSVSGIQRVRLGSLEPDFMTESILQRLLRCPQFCPQFHLALQSGCDQTLKGMHRRYTTEEYRRLCERLRQLFPRCTVTTDIMVGFPGETEQHFEQSLRFCESIGFARMHVFAYSPRSGTHAATFPNQISEGEKARRSRIMSACASKMASDCARQMIGQTASVLVETKMVNGRYEGYTDTYIPVQISTPSELGKLRQVHITDEKDGICIAE